jgi:glycosyltransferase involved in cell wall biosynthesis
MYLEKCIESLLSQTLSGIEIICVNDGSTDGSGKVLEKYSSEIKIIEQENKGQSSARNAGLSAAQGEYAGFLDSDDWADSSMFEWLYNNAKAFDSDIAMCSVMMYNEKTGEESKKDPYMTLDLFPENFESRAFSPEENFDFIFRICVAAWNKIYRRNFLVQNNIKFIEGLNFEDNVFFLDTYTSAKSVSIIKEPLVYYRQHSATSYSYAKEGHDQKKFDFFRVFEIEEEILKRKNLYKKLENYFEESKINTLKYWYNKISDEKVKKEFADRLSLMWRSV